MRKSNLAFINIYKILAAIIIGCFLHFQVFVLSPLNEAFLSENRAVLFLMGGKSNYLVELFFLMSGLLFAFVYKERIEKGELKFAVFMNKRIFRLIPLLVITTIAIFPLRVIYERKYGVSFFVGQADLNSLISSIFLSNTTLLKCRINPPGWQISKLIPCYILAYLLCRYHKRLGWITFIVPVMAGLIIQERGLDMPLLEFHMSRAYVAFFVGVLMESFLLKIETLGWMLISQVGG